MKTYNIGSISFTESGYKEFITLPKKEQLEKVYENLSPKDLKKAEKLLKNIPHGNISSRIQQEAKEDNTTDASGAGTGDNNTTADTSKTSKGKRAATGDKA